MNIRRLVFLTAIWCMCSAFAGASPNSPLVFQREVITISPNPTTIGLDDDGFPRAPRLDVEYLVEVRDEHALKLEEMHSLTQLKESTGVLIAFSAPTMIALPRLQISQALDVLFIDDEGTILQMLPAHVPVNANARMIADEPVKAWVYLQNGQIEARGLRPGDIISGSMFTPPPAIIR